MSSWKVGSVLTGMPGWARGAAGSFCEGLSWSLPSIFSFRPLPYMAGVPSGWLSYTGTVVSPPSTRTVAWPACSAVTRVSPAAWFWASRRSSTLRACGVVSSGALAGPARCGVLGVGWSWLSSLMADLRIRGSSVLTSAPRRLRPRKISAPVTARLSTAMISAANHGPAPRRIRA
ncbi:hypothetical protein ACFOUS_06210 [Deinococcus metalli]|uniref:hypothetical protein n=1 Tax=Deinococcus metalli TaxID=1141878 RepID=UPI00361B374F